MVSSETVSCFTETCRFSVIGMEKLGSWEIRGMSYFIPSSSRSFLKMQMLFGTYSVFTNYVFKPLFIF